MRMMLKVSIPVETGNLAAQAEAGSSVFCVILRYLENMHTVRVEIPAELVAAAGLDAENLSAEAARLLALELYRENKVSVGRAAELCHLPIEHFMEFAGRHNVPFHYGADDLEEDRRTLARLGL
ncbi:MAG: UPF0175 family protein [Acidobacteriia bacterium]|nr:UPF0175 family protein [Terriglobia bacterium]